MYKKFIALLIATLTALSMFMLVGSSSAEAVGKHCRKHSFTVMHKWDRDMPTGGSAGRVVAKDGSNPNYVMRAWFRGCPKSDHFHIWKDGQSFNFPNGTNPCGLGFQGMYSDFVWTPGGADRHIVTDCDSDGYHKETHKIDVNISELIAPPQPGLERTFWDKVHVKGAWSQISDHEKTWNDWIKY